MNPHLTTSASPAIRSAAGSVSSIARSQSTPTGGWKAPTRFLPAAVLMPVLPPTAASTMPSSEVATGTQRTPRSQQAATNPARSVTAPPPTPTTASVRVNPAAPSRVPARGGDLDASCRPRRRAPRSAAAATPAARSRSATRRRRAAAAGRAAPRPASAPSSSGGQRAPAGHARPAPRTAARRATGMRVSSSIAAEPSRCPRPVAGPAGGRRAYTAGRGVRGHRARNSAGRTIVNGRPSPASSARHLGQARPPGPAAAPRRRSA